MPPLPIRVPYTMIMFNRSWLKKKIKRERGGEGEGKRREQTDRREKKKKKKGKIGRGRGDNFTSKKVHVVVGIIFNLSTNIFD